jgi:hypothetical protein
MYVVLLDPRSPVFSGLILALAIALLIQARRKLVTRNWSKKSRVYSRGILCVIRPIPAAATRLPAPKAHKMHISRIKPQNTAPSSHDFIR